MLLQAGMAPIQLTVNGIELGEEMARANHVNGQPALANEHTAACSPEEEGADDEGRAGMQIDTQNGAAENVEQGPELIDPAQSVRHPRNDGIFDDSGN